MSVQAMSWAMAQKQVNDSPSRHVLLCLANYAGADGRGAFPSAATLSADTGLSERTVRSRLDSLEQKGLIRRGNQAIAAAYIDRADRRPVCYDLAIDRGAVDAPRSERGAGNAPREGDRGAYDVGNGVHPTTERGAGDAPNPSLNHQEKKPPIGGDDPIFCEAMSAYPKRDGDNNRRAALKAWTARVRCGVDPNAMLAGVLRYAAHIRAKGKEGTQYVRQAATFFGPDEHWKADYATPAGINGARDANGNAVPVTSQRRSFEGVDYGNGRVHADFQDIDEAVKL